MNAPSLHGAAMTCQELEASLFPYVDGELEAEDRQAVEKHLAVCARCRDDVETQRAFKRRLREVGRSPAAHGAPAPERLRQDVLAALRNEPEPRRVRLRAAAWPAAIAAAAAGVVLYFFADSERERASVFVAAAVAHHQRDLPLEVRDVQLPQIQSWFQGKVAFAPSRIPRLRQVDLIGARLSHISDREAAYVAYGTPSRRRVSLFVFDAPDLEVSGGRRVKDRQVLVANQHGYNVAIWKDHEIAYSLVSDLDEQDILELVGATEQH